MCSASNTLQNPELGVWWDSTMGQPQVCPPPLPCSRVLFRAQGRGPGNFVSMPWQCPTLSIPGNSQSLMPAQPARPSQQTLPRHRPALLLLQGIFFLFLRRIPCCRHTQQGNSAVFSPQPGVSSRAASLAPREPC